MARSRPSSNAPAPGPAPRSMPGLDALLLASIQDALIVTTADGVVTHWNEGATRLLGWTAEEQIGRPMLERFPETAHAEMAAMMKDLADGAEWNGEFEDWRKDGSRVWIEAWIRPFRDAHGRVVGILGISRDITARHVAERELAAREAFARGVLDAISAQVAVLDASGRIRAVNRAWERFAIENAATGTGRAARTEPGSNYLEVCRAAGPPWSEDAAAAIDGIERVLRGRLPSFTMEYECRLPTERRWFALQATPLGTPEGGAVVAHYDTTEMKASQREVREQTERLHLALSAARMGVWLFDLRTGGIVWSPEVQNVLGVSAFDGTLQGWLALVHPEERAGMLAAFERAMQTRTPFSEEFRIVRPDGTVRWLSNFGIVRVDEQGEPVSVVGTVQDITERREAAARRDQAEQALRESEERFRSVLDSSPSGIFLKDLEGRYLFVNRRLAAIAGRSQEDCVGRTAEELFPPEMVDRLLDQQRRVLETLKPQQQLETYLGVDGHRGTFLATRFPLFDSDGRPYAICGIAADISDRQQAEAERDRLWNQSPDPVCVAGFDGRFKQVNPAWTQRLGWTDEDLAEQTWCGLSHPDDAEANDAAMARLRSGELVHGFENRYRCRDGSYRWLSWNAVPIMDDRTIFGFARDVTEQKRLEDQVRQSQKMEAIGRLAGGVAHDFNNLLTIINGHCELMKKEVVTETGHDLLAAVHAAGQRAATLTAQLLTFSRRGMVEPKVLDVNQIVDRAARMLGRVIGENIHMATRLGDVPAVKMDPGHLEQILVNLVVNARDAMPDGGRLIVETRIVERGPGAEPTADDLAPGTYVELSVADTGGGMSSDVKARIFEPFYTSKATGKGTGLGLATVYGIVQHAGGAITVDSAMGRGATFRVLLPSVPEPVGPSRPDVVRSSPRGTETILVAEDEDGVRRLVGLSLKLNGYTVLLASSGAEAIRLAESHDGPLHLLVTDVVMPDVGGRVLADAVRTARPGIGVLFMSGYTDDEMVRQGVEAATDAFLAKPFTPTSLARKVREVLDAMSPRDERLQA